MSTIYKGDWICGSYKARTLGLREGWWYTWDNKPIRPATKTDKAAGAGIA